MKFPRPYTLKEIAELIGSRYDGDPAFEITGINEIHMVEPGDLTFVDHPKYYNKALNSKATTILINKDVERPDGKALLISDDPFRDFVSLASSMMPFKPSGKAISDTAEIGAGSVIQPGAFIGHHVKIGKNCVIHANASIYHNCVIGDNVIIHSNAVIGADAYYFQRKPEGYRKLESCGRVVIEDNVEIGALCTSDRGVTSDTTIGKGTKFDNQTQVGHDTHIGKNCLIGSQSAIAGVTTIEDNVIIWGAVVVNKDLTIGEGAVILGGSGVDKSLEGGKTYFGVPAIDYMRKWRELACLRKLPEVFDRL